VACSYARKGDLDHAFSWLDRAREAGFDDDSTLAGDPDLDALRDDPRFPKVHCPEKSKGKVKHEAEPDEEEAGDSEEGS
jgi:pentatricopeptide repeat protein